MGDSARPTETPQPEDVRDALRAVIDPELGVNVVDLGLVYQVEVADRDVRVALTMTTPACPLGDALVGQAEEAIRTRLPDLARVQVDLVWDPPWTPRMMSDAARERLGWKR
jgi:metal-sulfur cluster biosynthetic enzyme